MTDKVPAVPATPPAEAPDLFARMMAASQLRKAPFKNQEAHIRRAAMVGPENPVVHLPGRKTCLPCPHHARRHGVTLAQPDPDLFNDLIEKTGEGFDPRVAAAEAPPRTLAGIDVGYGPHYPVVPGFDDLARIKDPTVLADALFYNNVLPLCACTKALFAAADDEGWPGMRLDFLRQEAALQARPKPLPAVT